LGNELEKKCLTTAANRFFASLLFSFC